jgi:hypothetical protein
MQRADPCTPGQSTRRNGVRRDVTAGTRGGQQVAAAASKGASCRRWGLWLSGRKHFRPRVNMLYDTEWMVRPTSEDPSEVLRFSSGICQKF